MVSTTEGCTTLANGCWAVNYNEYRDEMMGSTHSCSQSCLDLGKGCINGRECRADCKDGH